MKRKCWILRIVVVLLILVITGGIGFYSLVSDLPSPEAIQQHLNTPSIRVVDRHDRLLYEALPESGGRHNPLPIESIPQCIKDATVATEDSRFYQHPGVDWMGILRAFWINLRGGETLAGGSTITQQVARNLLLSPQERYQVSLSRKLRESYLAWQLTRRYSKSEILGFYLNQSYYGSLAYGVEAAAQTYFGKPVSELDLAECALLAGLPQAPALYSPFQDPQAAKQRQQVVLHLMEHTGVITAEQRQLAEREPLVYAETPYPMEAPHFVLMALAEMDGLLTKEQIQKSEGLIVHTTLDLDWQHQAEQFINQQLDELRKTPDGAGHNVNDAALVALDPSSGAILTMVGSPDYYNERISGAINMALAERQPGSALKPLVYAAALTPGQVQPWTAATVIYDVRTSFVTHQGEAYTPSNYDLIEHGPVSVRTALASSLNIPAVITLDHVGLDSFFDFARQLGLDSFGNPDDYDLSLALGGGAVRLLDLTAAYGSFANGGWKVDPYSITQVTDRDGKDVYFHTMPSAQRVLDERVAWLISNILSDDEARQLGFGRNSILQIDRPAAVKTGTTSNFHDNWTVGYTPELVVGVWAGNASYEPMRNVSGVSGAAPIWHRFMRSVLSGIAETTFHPPAGLFQVEVCKLSGLLPTPACPYRSLEWFIQGTEPQAYDSTYHLVQVNKITGKLVDENTPPGLIVTRPALDLPPQAHPWARLNGLLLLSDLLATSSGYDNGAVENVQSVRLKILHPDDNSQYHLVADQSQESQRLLIEAAGEGGISQVLLWLDGQLLAQLVTPPYQAWWAIQPGKHQVWAQAVTSQGEKLQSSVVTFSVNP